MNNLPMGFSYARDADNSPLLKLIFPNMLRIGRMNTRSLDGPIRLPSGPQELMEKVEKAYTLFYKLWNITMVPKLMRMHKWYNGKAVLKVGDIVYFRKVESELSSKWTVGRVTEVVQGKDEIVRRATVQYQNSNEEKSRYTDRAARSFIKLFNIDDVSWQEDMDLVEKLIEETKVNKDNTMRDNSRFRLKAVDGEGNLERKVGVQHKPSAIVAKLKFTKPCNMCCCLSHCELDPHHSDKDVVIEMNSLELPDTEVIEANLLDRSWMEKEAYEAELQESVPLPFVRDKFMAMLSSIHIDLEDGMLEDPVLEEGVFED